MRLAAVDCGTNTLRLLIVEISDAGAHDLVRTAKIVRLGEGVDKSRRIGEPAMERARVALREYRSIIDAHDVHAVRMVATSATRDATNAADFATLVVDELGVVPEVITGAEEATLSFKGAVSGFAFEPQTVARSADQARTPITQGGHQTHLDRPKKGQGARLASPDPARPFLVIDIGGGSTEVIAGRAEAVVAATSVEIGAVRMTERHLHSDPPSTTELSAMRADIRLALRQVRDVFAAVPQPTVIGVAGTLITLAALSLGATRYTPMLAHGVKVDAKTVHALADNLAARTHQQREALTVIEPGRVDVIVAGAYIAHEVLEACGASHVVASEHDILDGIIASMQ